MSVSFGGYSLLASPDGRVWEELVQQTGYVADRSTIFFDPFRDKWGESLHDDSASSASRFALKQTGNWIMMMHSKM
jgi:hypothetical protein